MTSNRFKGPCKFKKDASKVNAEGKPVVYLTSESHRLKNGSFMAVAHLVGGGGWQYKVPHAYRHVRYVTPFPQ